MNKNKFALKLCAGFALLIMLTSVFSGAISVSATDTNSNNFPSLSDSFPDEFVFVEEPNATPHFITKAMDEQIQPSAAEFSTNPQQLEREPMGLVGFNVSGSHDTSAESNGGCIDYFYAEPTKIPADGKSTSTIYFKAWCPGKYRFSAVPSIGTIKLEFPQIVPGRPSYATYTAPTREELGDHRQVTITISLRDDEDPNVIIEKKEVTILLFRSVLLKASNEGYYSDYEEVDNSGNFREIIIFGRVTDKDTGVPISGAMIEIIDGATPYSTYTDGFGCYKITALVSGPGTSGLDTRHDVDFELSPAEIKLKASKEEFLPKEKVLINSENSKIIRISGTVKPPYVGQPPLKGAKVEIIEGAKPTYTFTNDEGFYKITAEVPDGKGERGVSNFDFVLEPETLKPEIKVVGGLSQYEGKYKDKVFRRGQDYPRFEVKASVPSGHKVEVDIFRNGNKLATLDAVWNGNKGIYVAIWDWESNEWSEIPYDIPVGEYEAKAKITAEDEPVVITANYGSGLEHSDSNKAKFNSIFEIPEGLSDGEKKAYLRGDSEGRDEIGVWFRRPTEYYTGIASWKTWYGADYGFRYVLTPFKEEVFGNAQKIVDGEKSPQKATEKLSRYVDDSFPGYTLQEKGWNPKTGDYEVRHLLLKQRGANCADMANLLTAYLRSVGIASHPTSIDANPYAKEAVTGKFGWTYHTWTEAYIKEAYINGEWKVTDPHDHFLGFDPVSRRKFGTSGRRAYIKKTNDIVLMGTENFNNNELNDKPKGNDYETAADLIFKYNPCKSKPYREGESVPQKDLKHKKPWVKDMSWAYWGENSYDKRDVKDPPSTYSLFIFTDKSVYRVGDLITINSTISNYGNTPCDYTLNLSVIDIIDLSARLPVEVVLYEHAESVSVPANTNITLLNQFNLPQNLDTTDEFYVKASYGNETDWAFFDIIPAFDTSVSMPSNMTEGEKYVFSLELNNTGNETLTDVNATLLASPDMLELLDGAFHYVGDLTPGEKVDLSWDVKAIGPSLGGVTFKIESENGGIDYIPKYAEIFSQPELDVEDEYVLFSGEFGKPFEIGFKVKNIGDLTATNVLAEITLPENVNATNTTWNIGDLAGGENVTLYTHITFTKTEDFVIDIFASDDAGHNTHGVIFVHILSNISASFNDAYFDYGLDTNGDGLYNYLMTEVGVDVTNAGVGKVEGWLYDSNGTEITKAKNSSYLATGNHSVILKFNGFDIYKHGVNGTYELRDLKLYNESEAPIDSLDYAYTTSAYTYTQFEGYLVDLSLIESDIIFNPETPAAGEPVNITATIHNTGTDDVSSVVVQFFDGDPDAGGTQIGSDQTISSIAHESTGTAQVTWTAIPGTHDIFVRVDPYNSISEASENNNQASKQITVSGVKTIYVDDDFTDDPAHHRWDTIQEGINDANDGDMVLVYNGTYYENVVLNKSITLTGVEMPTIDAQGSGDAINITADNCTVRGFSCVNAHPSRYVGIRVESDNNVIEDNTCKNNDVGIFLSGSLNEIRNNVANNNHYYGIRLQASDDNIITNNTAKDNGNSGIYLTDSNNNEIANNTANSNDHDGIRLYSHSGNNTLTNNIANSNREAGILCWTSSDNIFTYNNVNLNVYGIWLHNYSTENILANNTAKNNRKTGIYLKNSNNNRITDNDASNNDNYHGISLYLSNNNEIRNNIANDNHYQGVRLEASNENLITNSTAKNNGNNGIYLENSNNNKITDNDASNNDNYHGISLNTSNNNEIDNNTANSNSRCGIYLSRSSNNNIYLNNFIDNANNVYSYNSNNIWNSPSKITYTYNGNTYTNYLGNYWSDYNGSDADGDGIGEDPYIIDGDKDYYPLMERFEKLTMLQVQESKAPPEQWNKTF